LRQESLEPFSARDFSLTENQQAFEVIFKSVRQDLVEPEQFILENLPEEQDYILESVGDEPLKEHRGDLEKSRAEAALRELEEAIRLVMQLRQLSVNEQINQLRFLQADDEEPQDSKDLAVLLNHLNQLIQHRGKLDKALSRPILLNG
jgi:hypothetical protein